MWQTVLTLWWAATNKSMYGNTDVESLRTLFKSKHLIALTASWHLWFCIPSGNVDLLFVLILSDFWGEHHQNKLRETNSDGVRGHSSVEAPLQEAAWIISRRKTPLETQLLRLQWFYFSGLFYFSPLINLTNLKHWASYSLWFTPNQGVCILRSTPLLLRMTFYYLRYTSQGVCLV